MESLSQDYCDKNLEEHPSQQRPQGEEEEIHLTHATHVHNACVHTGMHVYTRAQCPAHSPVTLTLFFFFFCIERGKMNG